MIRNIIQRSLKVAYVTKYRGRVSIGAHCQVPFHTLSAQATQLTIGNYVRFGRRITLEGESFVFGDHSVCGSDVSIRGGGVVFELGKFSSIGARVSFLLGQGHHRPQALSNFPFGHLPPFRSVKWTQGFDYAAEVRTYCKVGHDVWIGVGSLILPNVTVGDGAIISAGSVVKQDVPPYAIVGGNPAQVISFRFKQSLIKELLELKWWDWPMERITRNRALLTTNLRTRPSLNGLPIVE